MTDMDILFKDWSKEELAVKPQDEIVHFGWEGNGAFAFIASADSYYEGAETLYQKMREAGKDFSVLDGHIYPLVFLYRHFIELYLKSLFIKYSQETEDNIKAYLNEVGHDLNASWAKVKPYLSKGKSHVGSKESIGAIEHYIHEMNKFDPTSMSMRYPVNKDLVKMFQKPKHLDYVNLHDRMAEFYHAIHQLDYDIDNQVLQIASEQEINTFLDNYQKQYSTLRRYLEAARNECEKEKDDKKRGVVDCVMTKIRDSRERAIKQQNGESVEDDYLWIYENSGDDFKIIVESLFYAGRSVEERLYNLSMNPAEKRKEFITCCINHMEYEKLKFGKPVADYQTNVFTKSAEAIVRNIETAIDLLK